MFITDIVPRGHIDEADVKPKSEKLHFGSCDKIWTIVLSGTRDNTMVPQLSKCLKFEAIKGNGLIK